MTLGKKPITAETPRDELLDYAIKEVQQLSPGEEFKLADLFLRYEWNRLPVRGVRSTLGTEFYNYFFKTEDAVPPGRGLITTRDDEKAYSAQGQRVYRRI